MEEKRWETLGQEYLYRSPWCSFRLDGVRLPDGVEIEYDVLEASFSPSQGTFFSPPLRVL